MSRTLFEILAGSADNDHSIGVSIMDHLSRLLNARQGSLRHLPDYGLPDVTEIYNELPYSVNKLMDSIKMTIEKYEPRLKSIAVTQKSVDEINSVLRLEIRGTLFNGDKIQFDTYFLNTGAARIIQC